MTSAKATTTIDSQHKTAGESREVERIEALLRSRGSALEALIVRAGAVRDRALTEIGRPGVVTYSRKVFIPLTRLCRDRCHYCVFVDTPGGLRRAGQQPYLSIAEAVAIARDGAALGCKEALITLGDRPEDRWAVAREWLDAHGMRSTLEYVHAVAAAVTAETGLLVHANPGVMSAAELSLMREVSPSQGMMLETTSSRLWATPGEPHFASPDKDPQVRLAVLKDAGDLGIPFTTGMLIGIGETLRERAQTLVALRDEHRRTGAIQEVIVQNFRAKPGTAMMSAPDAGAEDYIATVATARLVLDPSCRLQVPPNLSDPEELRRLLAAGIDDWGGVSPLTPDHVNPERPWPHVHELARLSAESGFTLRERLTVHPHFIREARESMTSRIHESLFDRVAGQADDRGLARDDALIEDLLEILGGGAEPLTDAQWAILLGASGEQLDRLCGLADLRRREQTGEAVTYVNNRNYDAAACLDDEELGAYVREAVDRGATEICVQGTRSATEQLRILRVITAAAPRLHVHAFRPPEVLAASRERGDSAGAWLHALRESGMRSMPGTAARILDDDVRARLTHDADISVQDWCDVVESAHRQGIVTTATMVFGHIETPQQQIAHLRLLADMQRQTQGFTELILMPAADVRSAQRRHDHAREARALTAVSRLMLGDTISHIQAAWPKVSTELLYALLRGGADDLGGTLLEGSIRPDAGQERGMELTNEDLRSISSAVGRPLRQRTTNYASVLP